MDILVPRSLEEALEMKAARPEAVPIAGGTDVMVGINRCLERPPAVLDLSRVEDLATWHLADGELFLGARMTFARILREVPPIPALRQASRSVGSPQIRTRGTLGGNLGAASPAGDLLPVLAVHDAVVELAAAGGRRRSLSWDAFLVGTKRTALGPDELIVGVRWRVLLGPQSFSKVGTRNAMVISVASLCFALDSQGRTVRTAIGSVAPTVLRTPEAEEFLGEAMLRAGVWGDPAASLPAGVVEGFADRVAAAARPIDDVRGTAVYRTHALRVLARRAVGWALADFVGEAAVS